ncbi:hypothetical protein CRT60_15670 [Azospirillum palustre]|uniref:Mutator family transposase n=1 Tax=Azospirillum palustre TaxID=2044885 RepID=A0A2B8BEQ2_9PROT|nr:hypothetical protein CRT60_15670 [Azospirillum palustre]
MRGSRPRWTRHLPNKRCPHSHCASHRRQLISDAHGAIKAAVTRVFQAMWQRCRVHFSRTALPCGRRRSCPRRTGNGGEQWHLRGAATSFVGAPNPQAVQGRSV